MKHTPDYTNDERKLVLRIDALKSQKSACEKELDKLVPAYVELVERKGTLASDDGKKKVYAGTFRESGELVTATLTVTEAIGTVDWQAYALALGGTVEEAEQYRKPGNIRKTPTIKRKKEKQ